MPLPFILVGVGLVTAATGVLAAVKGSARRRLPSSGDGLRQTAQWASLVEKIRGELPAWLLLGHIYVESRGNPSEVPRRKDGSVVLLKGRTEPEKGLLQIDQFTSRDLGLDHSRMFEPAYNLTAGVKMYRNYAAAMKKLGSYATSDDFWRAAYFQFALGGGQTKRFLSGQGLTWQGIEAAVRDFCTKNRCNPSVFSALNNNTTVWQKGHEVETLTRAVG
jgi:hypothetical protein